ncbi:HD-GYP domain-containing protein [uncultured Thalassolituus sp.]|uniref:HD-GYP domain-containing protein n=1 Tax=uncultured Thalassolituus sp. TaxID=285273 RepID=UPI00263337AB|nr:HD domain-containing phosphohydrolase [uncultured Thalassolituus sp.]
MALILCVDDEVNNLKVLRVALQGTYDLLFAKSGKEALALASERQPDLILLDVMMPEMDGFEVCRRLKQDAQLAAVPVIFVTALQDEADEEVGLECGAVDYITKPISTAIVKARVKNHLSLVRVDELQRTRLEIIQRLGRAAEYKDNETGHHVMRMSHYSQLIAQAMGKNERWCEKLLHAAPMHDIGKIGIPDAIMLKPGKLTDDEFDVMKTHPRIGAEILGNSTAELMVMAKNVALYHHEKWNGSGYPERLSGKDIPLEARIVALADVFDALTSERPYKRAWSVEEACEYIHDSRGEHFDPEVVEAFDQCLPDILKIKERWQEPEESE